MTATIFQTLTFFLTSEVFNHVDETGDVVTLSKKAAISIPSQTCSKWQRDYHLLSNVSRVSSSDLNVDSICKGDAKIWLIFDNVLRCNYGIFYAIINSLSLSFRFLVLEDAFCLVEEMFSILNRATRVCAYVSEKNLSSPTGTERPQEHWTISFLILQITSRLHFNSPSPSKAHLATMK